MSTHTAKVEWQRHDQPFLDGRYSRGFLIHFDGGISLQGSATPAMVRPPLSREDAADPEELLVAAVSSCHMLFFLDFARRAGLAVDRYIDAAEGLLGKDAEGQFAIVRITLRPDIAWQANLAPSPEVLADLHQRAHEACFIARSLRCPVEVAGVA